MAEKRKFYATRPVAVDGRRYASGDIVWTDRPRPGLREARESVAPASFRTAEPSDRLGDGLPEVSVIITFHQQREFAAQCVDSFVRQTLKAPYELVLVVDASDDGTAQFLRDRYGYVPGVRIFEVSYRNAGAARNFGLSVAEGALVANFDGDDYAYPEYLQKLKAALDAHPECGFSYSRFDYPKAWGDTGVIASCNSFEWSPSLAEYVPVVNTPLLMRRHVAEAAKCPTDMDSYEDYDRNLAIRATGATGVAVRERLWNYRLHPKSKWGSGLAARDTDRARRQVAERWGLRQEPAECTVVSLISRHEVLDEYFDALQAVRMPRERLHYFAYVDTADEALVDRVKEWAAHLGFLTTRIFVTGEPNLAKSANFRERAMRIAQHLTYIVNDCARRFVGTDFLFMTEDDTLAPPDAWEKLMRIARNDERIAFVSGVETSRVVNDWHIGACEVLTDDQGEIVGRIHPKPKAEGVEAVDGGGWYCWVGRVKRLLDLPKRCIGDGRYVGPDVMMVHDLRKRGAKCLVDWSVRCEHYAGLDRKGRKQWLKPEDAIGWQFDYERLPAAKAGERAWKTTATRII